MIQNFIDSFKPKKTEEETEQQLYQKAVEWAKLLQESAKQQLGQQIEKKLESVDLKKLTENPTLIRLEFDFPYSDSKIACAWFLFLKDQVQKSYRTYQLWSDDFQMEQKTFLGAFGSKDEIVLWDLFSKRNKDNMSKEEVRNFREKTDLSPGDFQVFMKDNNLNGAKLAEISIGQTQKASKKAEVLDGGRLRANFT